MATMATIFILLHIFLCFLNSLDGSVINIQTSHTNFKPLLTTNLTLRCSLRDSSPSSSIIGKRSVDGLTSAGNVIEETVYHHQQDDVTKAGQTKRSVVTQTDGNVKFGLSISLKRDGIELATMNEHVAATAAPGLTGFEVTGQLNNGGNSGETGYLELHWSYPSLSEAGSYNCEISAMDTANHIVKFGKSLEISADDVTVRDLTNSIHELIVDRDTKAEIIAQQNQTIAKQGEVITKQNQTITKLSEELKKLDPLVQDFNALKSVARTEPDIYFTAGLSASQNFGTDQPIIYDHVFTNVGAGYDNVTGYFTAPLTGYYKFDIYTTSDAYDSIVRLQVNGVDTVETFCWATGGDYPTAANSLITHLVKGDKVSAIARQQTAELHVWDIANYPTSSFSGQLLSIA